MEAFVVSDGRVFYDPRDAQKAAALYKTCGASGKECDGGLSALSEFDALPPHFALTTTTGPTVWDCVPSTEPTAFGTNSECVAACERLAVASVMAPTHNPVPYKKDDGPAWSKYGDAPLAQPLAEAMTQRCAPSESQCGTKQHDMMGQPCDPSDSTACGDSAYGPTVCTQLPVDAIARMCNEHTAAAMGGSTDGAGVLQACQGFLKGGATEWAPLSDTDKYKPQFVKATHACLPACEADVGVAACQLHTTQEGCSGGCKWEPSGVVDVLVEEEAMCGAPGAAATWTLESSGGTVTSATLKHRRAVPLITPNLLAGLEGNPFNTGGGSWSAATLTDTFTADAAPCGSSTVADAAAAVVAAANSGALDVPAGVCKPSDATFPYGRAVVTDAPSCSHHNSTCPSGDHFESACMDDAACDSTTNCAACSKDSASCSCRLTTARLLDAPLPFAAAFAPLPDVPCKPGEARPPSQAAALSPYVSGDTRSFGNGLPGSAAPGDGSCMHPSAAKGLTRATLANVNGDWSGVRTDLKGMPQLQDGGSKPLYGACLGAPAQPHASCGSGVGTGEAPLAALPLQVAIGDKAAPCTQYSVTGATKLVRGKDAAGDTVYSIHSSDDVYPCTQVPQGCTLMKNTAQSNPSGGKSNACDSTPCKSQADCRLGTCGRCTQTCEPCDGADGCVCKTSGPSTQACSRDGQCASGSCVKECTTTCDTSGCEGGGCTCNHSVPIMNAVEKRLAVLSGAVHRAACKATGCVWNADMAQCVTDSAVSRTPGVPTPSVQPVADACAELTASGKAAIDAAMRGDDTCFAAAGCSLRSECGDGFEKLAMGPAGRVQVLAAGDCFTSGTPGAVTEFAHNGSCSAANDAPACAKLGAMRVRAPCQADNADCAAAFLSAGRCSQSCTISAGTCVPGDYGTVACDGVEVADMPCDAGCGSNGVCYTLQGNDTAYMWSCDANADVLTFHSCGKLRYSGQQAGSDINVAGACPPQPGGNMCRFVPGSSCSAEGACEKKGLSGKVCGNTRPFGDQLLGECV